MTPCRPRSRWNATRVATVGFFLCLLSWQITAYKSSPHYGAGRRVKLDDIRTLTFYAGDKTDYRRTSPLPQLTCQGSPCRKFKPDAVQCTSMGDGQWKCSADLPPSIRMGRVEVSCEGYDYADDPYVLKDSCALTYNLLPAYGPDEDSRSHYRRSAAGTDWTGLLFQILFWSVLGYIAYSFINSLRRNAGPGNTFGGGGGGPGGGGGGGWAPGWGGNQGPPPPYMKQEPDSSASSSGSAWRPGFWTGLGLGGVAAAALNNRNRDPYQRARSHPSFSDRARSRFDDDYGPSFGQPSSSLRPSTGFGGTRNR